MLGLEEDDAEDANERMVHREKAGETKGGTQRSALAQINKYCCSLDLFDL